MFRLISYYFFNEKQKKETKPETRWGIGLPKTVMSDVLFGYHTCEEAKNFMEASDDAKKAYEVPLLAMEFVEHVAKGEQELAEKMLLEVDPSLRSSVLSQKVSVTDYSGRRFLSVTALQYAAWALDRHMWTMLKKYMSKEAMREQLEAMEREGGVEYELIKRGKREPEKEREMHYNFSQLTKALQHFINSKDEFAFLRLSCAQYLLPAHAVDEYFHPDREFYRIFDFEGDHKRPPRLDGDDWWETTGYGAAECIAVDLVPELLAAFRSLFCARMLELMVLKKQIKEEYESPSLSLTRGCR